MINRQRLRSMSNTLPEAEEEERQAPSQRLEESFTIHLGTSAMLFFSSFYTSGTKCGRLEDPSNHPYRFF